MPKVIQSSKPPRPEISNSEEIQILAHVDDLWKVQLFFPRQEVSDRRMLMRLREVKFLISQEYDIPTSLLEFRDLAEKIPRDDGFYAVLIVGMKDVTRGKPEIRLRPMETPRGELIPDMIAEMEFSYLDEFDHPITLERLKVEIKRQKIDPRLCDFRKIEEAVRQMHEDRNGRQTLIIATGELPDIGVDAELEYTFLNNPEQAESAGEYRAARRVKEGDILCRKIPPKPGKKPGKDVHGERIPPIQGFDFDLVAGEGARLSLDGTVLKALRDGVPYMKRKNRRVYTLAGEKIIPEKIEVSVKSIVSLKGDEPHDIYLEEPVEIIGDLQSGFSVSTDGEVFIEGDVDPGARVNSKDRVNIEGDVRGGEITSGKSVYAFQNVSDARITAGDEIVILGLVQNSELSGCDVKAEKLVNSKVEAGRKVTVHSVGAAEGGKKTRIRVGREEYYRQRLEEQQREIDALEKNLRRIREVFGKDLLEQLDDGNQHRLLMQYIRKLVSHGKTQLDSATIESFRRLLESFSPLQEVISEKLEDISSLKRKAADENSKRPIVVIREKIESDVEISLHGETKTIKGRKGGAAVTTDKDGKIKLYSLKSPSRKKNKKKKKN